LGAESPLRTLAFGAEGAAAEVLAAALGCPNKLLDGIPNAGAASELPALLDWPEERLDGVPKAGAANKFPAMLDWPNKLFDGVPKAGAANKLPAELDCSNKPLGCRPSDDAVVLAAVFAGAKVVAGVRPNDGRACEVDEEEAEDWKRPAVADAAGKPPGCGGLCRHHKKEAEENKSICLLAIILRACRYH